MFSRTGSDAETHPRGTSAILPVIDAEAQVRRSHVADDEDHSMKLDESTAQVRRCDFSHPDGYSSQDHESASAGEEAKYEKHGHVLGTGHDCTRDQNQKSAYGEASFPTKLVTPPR